MLIFSRHAIIQNGRFCRATNINRGHVVKKWSRARATTLAAPFLVGCGGESSSHWFSTTTATTAHRKVSSLAPSKIWAQAQAVCFDVDCTITKQDALDDLADFLGKGPQVAAITTAAMNGDLDLDQALQKRLDILEPTVDKLALYIASNPAQSRLVPGIQELIAELQNRNIEVFLISGGFRELILPVADVLSIPRSNIFANRFVYMADDGPLGESNQIRVRGFDSTQPTSRKGGKTEAIRRIRNKKPLQTVVMVGDGITDLEAVQETGGADLFVGYGGIVERAAVKDGTDWFVYDYQDLINALPRLKVAVVGSGAFASAVMQMISRNTADKPMFQEQVEMYVYDELYQQEDETITLSSVINRQHENPKYLPNVKFGENVIANPSLTDTIKDADLIVFCAPHQYMYDMCKQIQSVTKPTALAISLIKGIHLSPHDGPQLLSSMVRRTLNVECAVMMGANLAHEIGPGGLCEATIGSHVAEQGHIFRELFETNYFTVNVITDVEGTELAGALKNIVALAAGFVDGCQLGQNAKAVILRQGLDEMRRFAKAMYPTVRDETFFESCGVGDLIATCYGGRNHRVAEAFAKSGGEKSFVELEDELLNGQKVQGTLTSMEVKSVLRTNGWYDNFPLFAAVQAILEGLCKPKDIVRFRDVAAASKSKFMTEDESESTLLEKTINRDYSSSLTR
eukprot:scaffold1569_cov171-Amphora_coffeaeformis.AAC.21